MSYKHNRFALDAASRYKLSSPAAQILLVLAVRSDDDGCCHPSIRKLAADTRRKPETVIAAIAELEAAGLLGVVHGARRIVNQYTVPTQPMLFGPSTGNKEHPAFGAVSGTKGAGFVPSNGGFVPVSGSSFVPSRGNPTTPELHGELAALRPDDVLPCPNRPTGRNAWCNDDCPLCHGMHHVHAEQLNAS